MTISVFRQAAGGVAGALVVLLSGLTCAATLNQNLRTAPEAAQSLVGLSGTGSPVVERPRAVQIAQATQIVPAKKPLPGIKPAEPPATAAEIVGKMLAPGASNPDVPLPHPDLAEKFATKTEVATPLSGPTPFGRSETGGGVLGLRMPIPVERSSGGGSTISSSGGGGR